MTRAGTPSAVTKCRYCAVYHTGLAKLNGATEAEIGDALHYAKSSAGWSTHINGLQVDYDRFRDEVPQACEHVRALQGGPEQVPGSAWAGPVAPTAPSSPGSTASGGATTASRG